MKVKLKKFIYKFDKGPLRLNELKKDDFTEGNCRLAIQYYFYKVHNLYLKPSLILAPKSYEKVGRFIIEEGKFDINSLKVIKEGDIIYAERIKDERKNSRKEWIIGLHTAIYVGNHRVWHSTSTDKQSSFWNFGKFLKYYNLVGVKRIL